VAQKPASELPPAPPSDADLNKAIADFAAGRISASDLEAALAGETVTPANGDGQQQPGTPPDPAPVMSEVTRRTIEAANAALAQIPGGPKTAPYQGPLRYAGTDWDAVLARASSNATLSAMVANIRDLGASPLFTDVAALRRANSISEIPTKFKDGRLSDVPVARRELFALAMSDVDQTAWLKQNGVPIALSARVTQQPQQVALAVQYLDALSTYTPMQRPGTTAWDPNVALVPGGEGVWLATAWGICASIEMQQALGSLVPNELTSRLEQQLRAEVARICEDWASKRPWFVSVRTPTSNQWLEPSLALVKACLFLGDADLLPAYNLGVENLRESIQFFGQQGEYLEGVNYAQQSLGELHDTLGHICLTGDNRLEASGFAANNWKWFGQMHLPGGLLVNCNDCRQSMLPDFCRTVPFSAFSESARAVGTKAVPMLRFLYPNPTPIGALDALKYADYLAVNSAAAQASLPTFAHFPGQEMVLWRTRFEPIAAPQTAYALWLKGGTSRENHIHREQGNVTIVVGNRIVLSNCGTTEYNAPDYSSGYAGAGGSSMMQVGEVQPCSQPVTAPVFVNTLGPAGGNVDMNTSAAYLGANCTRNVSWDSVGNVRLIDNVSLPSTAASGTEIYRFHTGSAVSLNISGSDKEWDVTWNGTSVHFSADSPIVVDQVTSPNKIKAPNQHQTIRIKTKNGTSRLQLVSDFVIDLSVTQ